MLKEKLSEEKIRYLEEWAEAKKKTVTNEIEKSMITKIENLKKDNWRGYRLESTTVTTLDEAQERLKRLKERRV